MPAQISSDITVSWLLDTAHMLGITALLYWYVCRYFCLCLTLHRRLHISLRDIWNGKHHSSPSVGLLLHLNVVYVQEQFSSYANFKVETPVQLIIIWQILCTRVNVLQVTSTCWVYLFLHVIYLFMKKSPTKVTSKYNFKNISEQFMNNAIWKQSIKEIISDIEKCAHDQVYIDAIYEEFVDNVHNEINAFLKKLD